MAQVGIGITSPDTTAMLDIQSTGVHLLKNLKEHYKIASTAQKQKLLS